MYFKKLEIFGFKSFAEKTVLNFEDGITAIVGPNGCGKSNIFDSIRWVLGEQSIKQLRGSSKEDIIFNGTQSKPPLGFAEVSLTFSNESRVLPIEYDEVTVTRRLYRSGDSEYLLNKTTVRLKDIQELFMGTGIGAAAYSLVQQGKVDLVVSAKPEERRSIFDEASGITKYKAKKKEALNKLKSTEDNLLRVNDITTEVKRQIGSCERQANKARKYKEEFEKLKDIEIRMAQHQMKEFTSKKESMLKDIHELQSKKEQMDREHTELSTVLTNEINYLGEVEQQIHDINSQQIKLDGQIDLNNRQVGFNQERIDTLRQNVQRLTEQKEQLIERCRVQQEKIEEIKQNLIRLEESINLNKTNLSQKKEELHNTDTYLHDSKQKIVDTEEKILTFMSNQVDVQSHLTDIMKNTQGALARKRRLEMEQEKVSHEKQEVDQKLQNIGYQINTIEGTVADLNKEKEKKDHLINELEIRLEQVNASIDDKEKEGLFLKSQKEFIEQMTTQYEGMPDPIIEGRLIVDSKPVQHHSGIIGKVKEVLPLEQTIPNSFFQFNRDSQPVKQKYEITCEAKFIELNPGKLAVCIDEITANINQLMSDKYEVQRNLAVEREILQEYADEILAKEKTRSILEAQKGDVTEGSKKLCEELTLVDSEMIEVNQSLEESKKKEDEYNFQLESINQEIEWCQENVKEYQSNISEKAQLREDMAVSIAQMEAELQSEEGKVTDQQGNLQMFSEALDNWLEEMKKIDDEVGQFQQKKEAYQKEMEDLQIVIQEIRQQKEAIHETSLEYQRQKQEVAQKINSIRTNITGIEDEVESIKHKIHEYQMVEQELAFSEKGIKDRLFQSYRIDYDEVIQQLDQEGEQAHPFIPAEVEETLVRLRKRCESFGNVNLDAMDEYEELKERFEFLTQQQADLLEAKSQLMSTINKINRSTRQMFMDTFTKVSEEFRIYFRMLFGGGEAQLILLDQENVLESGIDIIARPPGKKLQNISLLSGGEKTLTAIALIFGVFKVNPSPFCVLDEIDAALDESNVGRFSYLLQDFAKIAQFIVITHNKKTIASSDVMYGITMPETGVSRIVSVKFAEDQNSKKPEEVPAGV